MGAERYMEIALAMAKETIGQTSPNPSVGCVIAKDGEIVGLGAHLRAGTEHAEIHALQQAGENARGAELFVTLEPCSHYGKTPPCVNAILEHGIRKVYIAVLDPNPLVAGRGAAILEEAGVDVDVGILEEEALELNKMFFHYIKTNRPYVTLKSALTLDGKMATSTGDSKWITSQEARLDVHQYRHRHDAILIGSNTALKDNPHLTTRLPHGGRNPIRIVLDSSLKIRLDANILHDHAAKTIFICSEDAPLEKEKELVEMGMMVKRLKEPASQLSEVLDWLGEQNITSLFVEGGSAIHTSFIEEGLFQEIVLYVAPKLLGGKGAIPFIGGESPELMAHSKPLEFASVELIGKDIKIVAKPC
ncbi:bifunctional diaminohydroxyphosphoribosylaminopyrimidine deaminase/5-amino-6-(5-phosphoribosylamino)uracil reductase RibD [Falsibacillus albus]|uniref:Riboflavin biosynthesis protein RibD n=1 Tax=Falsibacillus albus TaxID=2478915 RepID=A0A3L7JWZ2_9BACI|nr:bifunctional diaminohydroxyphosphoribosylaminopyrimidine deaminase/5-amino-6-(5-phosphoribosylamino)uracil reductase RibD [Falsibacillus albus]